MLIPQPALGTHFSPTCFSTASVGGEGEVAGGEHTLRRNRTSLDVAPGLLLQNLRT